MEAPRTKASDPLAEFFGWYIARRCTVNLLPKEGHPAFHIGPERVQVLSQKGVLEQFPVKLAVDKQSKRAVLSGQYSIGRAKFIVDGNIMVDDPWLSPSHRARYKDDVGLKTFFERISFREMRSGWLIERGETRFDRVNSWPSLAQCIVDRVPGNMPELRDNLKERAAVAGHRDRCTGATACCRASKLPLESGSSWDDEENRDICEAHAALTPQFCTSWLLRTTHKMRNPDSETVVCELNTDGKSKTCTVLDKPRPGTPTPVPQVCTEALKSAKGPPQPDHL